MFLFVNCYFCVFQIFSFIDDPCSNGWPIWMMEACGYRNGEDERQFRLLAPQGNSTVRSAYWNAASEYVEFYLVDAFEKHPSGRWTLFRFFGYFGFMLVLLFWGMVFGHLHWKWPSFFYFQHCQL